MKKHTIPASLFLATVLLCSCRKESSFAAAPPVSSPVSPANQAVKIVSQWFSPAFDVVYDRNTIFLKSHQVSATPLTYDRATHTQLAFVKLNYQGAPMTMRLRAIFRSPVNIANKLSEIDFSISETGCIVTVKNADKDAPSIITTNPFPDMQVRYIVIPKTFFETLGIDWNDYTVVAQALNI